MRSRIKSGKLSKPPVSVSEAISRLRALEVEVHDIETQIANALRASLYDTPVDYDEWKAKAKRARAYLMQESQILREFIAQHPPETVLLRAAYDLLSALAEDGVDFDDKEKEVIASIAKHFEGDKEIPDQKETG